MNVAMKRSLLDRRRPKHYGLSGEAKTWKGPVERREPRHYQRQTDVGIARCANRWCKLWISSATTRCPHCHTKQAD
jgi:hypothetical protein